MLVLAFDPSIKTTGVGVVDQGSDHLVAGELIRIPDTQDLHARVQELIGDVRDTLKRYTPDVVVVELPAATGISKKFQGFKTRSSLHLPTYGIAVGVILAEAFRYADQDQRAPKVITRPSDAWTKGLPGTANDPHKTARVRLVESIYRLNPGALGAETIAGNVADAILLARHVAVAMHTESSIKEIQSCPKEPGSVPQLQRRRGARGAGTQSPRASG